MYKWILLIYRLGLQMFKQNGMVLCQTNMFCMQDKSIHNVYKVITGSVYFILMYTVSDFVRLL